MAQSFLNDPSLPLGLRNNNPGNLRPLSGGVKWLGEIEPDLQRNFSRFKDVGYGIRAMITDITGDIVKDGRNTLRELITAYAPPGENNTAAYIAAVAARTGMDPDAIIQVNEPTIRKIIQAKIAVEIGPGYAARISSSDITEGFNRLSDQVKAWLNYKGRPGLGVLPLVLAVAAVTILLKK